MTSNLPVEAHRPPPLATEAVSAVISGCVVTEVSPYMNHAAFVSS